MKRKHFIIALMAMLSCFAFTAKAQTSVSSLDALKAALASTTNILVDGEIVVDEAIAVPAGTTVGGDGTLLVRTMVYVVSTENPYPGVSYNKTATKNGSISGTVGCNVAYEISLDGGETWFDDTTNGKAQAVTVKEDGTKSISTSFQSAFTSAKSGEIVHMLKDAHVQSTNSKKNNGPLRSYYGLILEGNGHTIYTDLESSGASNEYATIKFTSYLAGTGADVRPVLKNVTINSQNNSKADLDLVSGDVTFTVSLYNVNLLGKCQYATFPITSKSAIINNSNVKLYDSKIPSWDAGSAKLIEFYSGEYSLSFNPKCKVYGGTFSNNPSSYLADCAQVKQENGKYVVSYKAAEVKVEVTPSEEFTSSATEEEKAVANELAANTAVSNETLTLPVGVSDFTVQLTDIEATAEATTKVTFNVEPKDASGEKVSNPSEAITFRLPVPAAWSGKANVYHGSDLLGAYDIKEDNGAKFVELSSANFSEFAVEAIFAAQVGETPYATFAEAAAAAQAGSEIKLLANIEGDITVPANVTLNGNGFAISGGILAEGDITFAGVTTAADFDANVVNTAINIPAGASLQLTGSARLVIGHGATFNITGTIEDAKTADKATLVPSLKIAAGASITGNGVTFNVNNAYIVSNANTTSKNSNANGTLDFNINNSIWEQTGVLAFYVPTSGKDPVVNFDLKNSVLTTTSHLVFSVTKGEIVIDNSLVNQGTSRQIENRSTMTIKNGSVVNGAVATSSNAINPGTIIVENATYAVTGEFSGAAEGTGTLVIKKGANVSVGSIKAGANVKVDAEGMAAGDEINFTANLSQFTGELSVINNDKLEAQIVNGKVVLAAKPVAKIGETPYTTIEAAFAAATEGQTITILDDATPALTSQRAITKAAVIDLGGKTMTLTEDDLYFGTTTFKNGTIVVDPSVKPSTAVFWMFANQTLTFDAVKVVATGVTGTYLIGLEGDNSDLNLLNGSEILVENTTALDLDIICVNGTNTCDIKVENSKVNVTNIDGRVFFRGNYTVKDSEVNLAGITKAGFRIEAGQTLSIEGTSKVNIEGEPRDGGIHLTDASANYTKAETATVNATVNEPKVAKIGETTYKTLQAAIEAVQEGETIILVDNVNVTTPAYGQNALNHARAINFTLDLNGKTLSANTGNSVFRFNIANSGATSNVTLTIKNGKIVAGSNTWCAVMASGISSDVKAIMNLENLTIEASKAGDLAVKAWDNATINANNVTVNATNAAGGFYAVGGEIVLDNCTVNQKGLHTAPYLSMAFAVSTNGKMTVNSGTYSAEPTAAAEGSNQGSTHGSWVGGVMNSGGELIINGGTFSNGNFGDDALATSARGLIFADTKGKVTVNGGTFNALKSIFDFQNNLGGTSPVITVKGGNYSANPAKVTSYGNIVLDANYVVVENNGVWNVVKAAAKIETTGYATLAEAVKAVKEGETITILAGTHSEGTIKLPATLKNVTIKGESVARSTEGAVLKDMTISAADGNAYSYEGLTFDGITFDNSRILLTGWRNGDEIIKNLAVTNCTFKNLNDNTNTAPIHINKDASEAVNGFTFTNNVIDGATGGSKSGIYAQVTGEVKVENNIINNVSFRPYVIQVTTDDGIADNFTVKGNTFSGSAVGRAQGLGNKAEGTDNVNLVVSNNIFKGITDSQQICYWNFNPETTTADLSKNYYDIDIVANPGKIYFNSPAADNYALRDMNVFPIYTVLNENGTINTESAFTPKFYIATVGENSYETLSEAFAAVTDDAQTVVVLRDVTENLTGAYLRGNITTENGAKVTINLTNSDWVACPYTFVLGENVTLNVNYGLFYYAGGSQINGTVVTGAYYQRYAGTKLTINEPGSMTVTSETCIIRYMDGDANAGIYINGDNNDETIGLKLAVAYFYQGMINAKDANIQAGTYWQTNETDGQGSANLVLDNSKLVVSVYDHPAKATGNSTVTLTNGSVIDAKNGGFTYGDAATLSVDATSKIIGKNGETVMIPIAKIGTTKYATLEDAFKAATEGCTIEILSDVTVDYAWDARKTGAKFTVPVTINGNGKTIKFTNSVNDNNYQAAFRFEADATVKNLIVDMSEVTDSRFRAISSKGNLTVDGCKFIGKDESLNCRAIIFGEGAGANVGNLAISITNSEFINWKRGITDNENAQDVKTVTITGNKLTDAGVGVSAKETVTFTGNTVAGAYVNIKSYTAGNKLAVTATGNTLEANTETAYNVINAGGAVKADEGFNVVAVAKFGDTYYATLAEAIAASTPETGWGGEVTLLKDITLEGGYADADEGLRIEKSVTINGAGYTIDCGQFVKGIRIYQNADQASNVMFKNINIVNNNAKGRCIDTRSGKINLMLNGGVNLTAHGTNSQPLTIGGSEAMTKVTISGGTIDAGTSGYGVICFVPVTNHINVQSNAVIKGLAAFYLKEGVTNTAIKLQQATSIGTNKYAAASGDFGAIVIEGSNNVVRLEHCETVVKAVAADGAEMAAQAAFLFKGSNNTVGYYNATPQVITEGGQSYFVMAKANVTGTKFVKNSVEMVPEAATRGYQFITVEDALRYAKNGDTVKLLANAELDETYVNEKSLTLDLNGKTLSTAYVAGSTTNHLYAIQNNAELTITDSSDAKDGKISARGNFNYGTMTLENGTINAIDGNGGYGVRNYAGATFTMNGGTIATTLEDDHQVNNGGYDATTVRVDEGATFTMNGGELNNICDYTFAIENYGTTTVKGGKATSVHTTVANYGTINIEGGEFVCNGLEGITAHAVWAAEGTTNISGGTFDGKDNYNGFNVDASEGAVVNITGGTFLPVHSGSLYGDGTITVSGGTFFDKISDQRCELGFQAVVNTEGTYDVKRTDKREAYTIVDGQMTEFVNEKEIEIGTLTYQRTFSAEALNNFQPLYLPFEIPVSELLEKYDVAYINDFRETFDANGNIVEGKEVIELVLIKSGTLKANHPYVIRPKSVEALEWKLVLNDAKLHSTNGKNYSVECSSATKVFTFKGIYKKTTRAELAGDEVTPVYVMSKSGSMGTLKNPTSALGAFRFYMMKSNKDGSPYIEDVSDESRVVRFEVIGEQNENGETVIYDIKGTKQSSDRIFNLQGRRVLSPVKGNLYIINGKKVVY